MTSTAPPAVSSAGATPAQPPKPSCTTSYAVESVHSHRLRPNCRFRDAADVWLAGITEPRADATIRTYAHWLDTVVLPQLGELRLSELNIARMVELFGGMERDTRARKQHDGRPTTEEPRHSASTRRTIRSVVSGILQRAVLDGAIPANPIPR